MTELSGFEFDVKLLLERVFKYFIEGSMVALAAFVIPSKKSKLNWEEITMIALTAAATFAVLDMYATGMAHGARQGAAFGIGANLVNFPRA